MFGGVAGPLGTKANQLVAAPIGDDSACRTTKTLSLSSGTLNVFRGKNTAHRVTTVEGGHARIIAVFSYYEAANVAFSDAERLGFYGRTG